MATTQTCATVPTDRINFINENDGGSVFFCLFEEVAHS